MEIIVSGMSPTIFDNMFLAPLSNNQTTRLLRGKVIAALLEELPLLIIQALVLSKADEDDLNTRLATLVSTWRNNPLNFQK